MPPPLPSEATGDEAAILREALRIRVRWVQELMARAARELGRRLVDARRAPGDPGRSWISASTTSPRWAPGPPSPATRQRRRAVRRVAGRASGSRSASGSTPMAAWSRSSSPGRARASAPAAASGPARSRSTPTTREPGSVLVVDELRPALAPVIGRLAGLVAETGSPLAHVAILAREAHVPTVVGVTGVDADARGGAARRGRRRRRATVRASRTAGPTDVDDAGQRRRGQ